MLSSTSVPASSSLQTASLPPTSLARSRMPCKPKCPGRPFLIKKLRVDALAIISHAQPEALVVVVDFHLNAPRLRVPEGIAQRLASNPVDFVAQNGMQTLRRASYIQAKRGNIGAGDVGREFFRQVANRLRKIIGLDRG